MFSEPIVMSSKFMGILAIATCAITLWLVNKPIQAAQPPRVVHIMPPDYGSQGMVCLAFYNENGQMVNGQCLR